MTNDLKNSLFIRHPARWAHCTTQVRSAWQTPLRQLARASFVDWIFDSDLRVISVGLGLVDQAVRGHTEIPQRFVISYLSILICRCQDMGARKALGHGPVPLRGVRSSLTIRQGRRQLLLLDPQPKVTARWLNAATRVVVSDETGRGDGHLAATKFVTNVVVNQRSAWLPALPNSDASGRLSQQFPWRRGRNLRRN